MENLKSNRIKVKFMNPLLEIDIFGYSVEDTKRFFNTILRIDKERNNIERKNTEDTLELKLTDSAGFDPLVDEGKPLPFSSVENDNDRTLGKDVHGEGGLFEASNTNSWHKPEEH